MGKTRKEVVNSIESTEENINDVLISEQGLKDNTVYKHDNFIPWYKDLPQFISGMNDIMVNILLFESTVVVSILIYALIRKYIG